jgi:hypothetical protein
MIMWLSVCKRILIIFDVLIVKYKNKHDIRSCMETKFSLHKCFMSKYMHFLFIFRKCSPIFPRICSTDHYINSQSTLTVLSSAGAFALAHLQHRFCTRRLLLRVLLISLLIVAQQSQGKEGQEWSVTIWQVKCFSARYSWRRIMYSSKHSQISETCHNIKQQQQQQQQQQQCLFQLNYTCNYRRCAIQCIETTSHSWRRIMHSS